MKITSIFTSIVISLCAVSVLAQQKKSQPAVAPNNRVTVTSNGFDVRQVLSEVFTQAQQQYIYEAASGSNLYLSFKNMPFQKALDLICSQCRLQADFQDGIYIIRPKDALKSVPKAVIEQPKRLPQNVLDRRLTVSIQNLTIALALKQLGTAVSVPIQVDKSVPKLKLDAKFDNATLKYALNEIDHVAKLHYEFTDHDTLLISAK